MSDGKESDMAKYRQGDVLLASIDKAPANARRAERDGGRLIVARGEATGHSHQVMEPGSAIWDEATRRVVILKDAPASDKTAEILTAQGGAILIRAYKKAQLVHEEHKPIDLDPGIYEYRPQREHRPWGEVRVSD